MWGVFKTIKHVYMQNTITYNGLFNLVSTCEIVWEQLLAIACLG